MLNFRAPRRPRRRPGRREPSPLRGLGPAASVPSVIRSRPSSENSAANSTSFHLVLPQMQKGGVPLADCEQLKVVGLGGPAQSVGSRSPVPSGHSRAAARLGPFGVRSLPRKAWSSKLTARARVESTTTHRDGTGLTNSTITCKSCRLAPPGPRFCSESTRCRSMMGSGKEEIIQANGTCWLLGTIAAQGSKRIDLTHRPRQRNARLAGKNARRRICHRQTPRRTRSLFRLPTSDA